MCARSARPGRFRLNNGPQRGARAHQSGAPTPSACTTRPSASSAPSTVRTSAVPHRASTWMVVDQLADIDVLAEDDHRGAAFARSIDQALALVPALAVQHGNAVREVTSVPHGRRHRPSTARGSRRRLAVSRIFPKTMIFAVLPSPLSPALFGVDIDRRDGGRNTLDHPPADRVVVASTQDRRELGRTRVVGRRFPGRKSSSVREEDNQQRSAAKQNASVAGSALDRE